MLSIKSNKEFRLAKFEKTELFNVKRKYLLEECQGDGSFQYAIKLIDKLKKFKEAKNEN